MKILPNEKSNAHRWLVFLGVPVVLSSMLTGQDKETEEEMAKKWRSRGGALEAQGENGSGGERTRGVVLTDPEEKPKRVTRGIDSIPVESKPRSRGVILDEKSLELIGRARGHAEFLSFEPASEPDEGDGLVTRQLSNSESEPDDAFGKKSSPPVVEVKKVVVPEKNSESKYGDIAAKAGTVASKIEYDVDPATEYEGEIRFRKGTTEIVGSRSTVVLRSMGAVMNRDEFRDFHFAIEGHASADGDAAFNQKLSQKRANEIFLRLTQEYGVSPERLLPVGYGESEAQVPSDAPEEALKRDRRVLIYKMQ
ncbi:MAG: hypothetical protein CMO55_06665 [Verrucomicrobiales bacterium]|nr:hypothetical protein [Verrucomicrobiales bacterium]